VQINQSISYVFRKYGLQLSLICMMIQKLYLKPEAIWDFELCKDADNYPVEFWFDE
jgi:hypothetical protein